MPQLPDLLRESYPSTVLKSLPCLPDIMGGGEQAVHMPRVPFSGVYHWTVAMLSAHPAWLRVSQNQSYSQGDLAPYGVPLVEWAVKRLNPRWDGVDFKNPFLKNFPLGFSGTIYTNTREMTWKLLYLNVRDLEGAEPPALQPPPPLMHTEEPPAWLLIG